MCHGKNADGDGPAAAALPDGVPSLVGQIPATERDALLDTIMNGMGSMPAFSEELDRRDARRILTYLDKLENTPPPDEPADANDTAQESDEIEQDPVNPAFREPSIP
jgi:mono/diheme cytochrome c family protein